MVLGPWSVNPAWQNFSSLYREAQTAIEAPTEMEKSHHLTAALYFGIATLETFLNDQMRAHLSPTKSSDEVLQVLRNGRFSDKVSKWPTAILQKPLPIGAAALDLLALCNEVRGHLTHPKGHSRDVYDRLLEVEPMSFVDAVGQFIACFHEAQQPRYPYWLFGWNYLNPRPKKHEIILINDQQFCHSISALGLDVPGSCPIAWCRSTARKG